MKARKILKYGRKYYSQNGEDGILLYILKKLNLLNNLFLVEFGAWDGVYLSNLFYFIEKFEACALLIEADKEKYKSLESNLLNYPKAVPLGTMVEIDGDNSLDNILKNHNFPIDFDVLSIDVDGDDYHIWKNLIKYKPKIIIIEINIKHKYDVDKINKIKSPYIWGISGTSAKSMVMLANQKGYNLICQISTNLIFVRNDYYNDLGLTNNSLKEVSTFENIPFKNLLFMEKIRKITEFLRRRMLINIDFTY